MKINEMSQRKSNKSSVGNEDDFDVGDAAKECVRFILFRDGSKIPMKRAEIVKFLNSACQIPPGQVNAVIVEANRILKRIYGYKLVQVESKSGIQYIMILTEECESLQSNVIEPYHRRLLDAALMHIFMTGGSVKEDDMWKFLSEAGLLEENDHSGRKILTTTFTRQMYLLYTKVGEGDLARYVFEWGQRATEEVPKIFLLNKMAEAFGKTPNHWCEQYKEATSENQT